MLGARAGLAETMVLPEVYEEDAKNDLNNLGRFDAHQKWHQRLQAIVERGRPTCTKLIEERGIGTPGSWTA